MITTVSLTVERDKITECSLNLSFSIFNVL
nr:MAG TPA: hypothetical protein [Bacteriophage sp.]